MILRYIFGTDIFISYVRADGKEYAKRLKDHLTSMDYACFIDYDKLYAGDELGKALEYAIQRSRIFILVGTHGVRQSEHVPKEVAHFFKTGRKLIPINVQGGLRQPAPWDVIQHEKLIWLDEPNGEEPSQVIYDEVNRLFKRNRRNVWIRSLISTVGVVLLTVSFFAFWKASEARANQRKAEEKTAQLEQEQKNRQRAPGAEDCPRR
jgi:hypothetical protein